MATAGFDAMRKLVADIIVETLQDAGVKHGRGGDVWEMVKENFL
jgi:hypothetical protein